jgi:alpha-tubulin suppressor-like RCC1 family protein
MNTREEILARLLEGTIEESELPALRDEIARDPAFAAEIADLTRIDRLLRFQAYLETEKPDLVIGVLKRLECEEQDPKAFNHAWQRKINQQQNRGRLAKLIRFVVTPLAIAASLAVVAGGVWWWSQPQAGALELRVVEVRETVSGFRFQGSGGPESGVIESPSHPVTKEGEAGNIEHRTSNIERRSEDAGATLDTRHSTLKVDDILRPGDGVEVGANGYAKLVYPDRTQVELRQNTRLRVALGEGENKDAKRLALDGGKLVCSAVPQKKAFEIQTSHAVSRVVGTRFSLDVTEAESRLGVLEGNVDLIQGEKSLLVSAGKSAVATAMSMEMAPAPAGGGSKIYAWGDNQYGQLGIGTTNNCLMPVLVPGLSGAIAIAAGKSHTLALRGDGTVWACGGNWYGQLGDGTKINRTAPVPVILPDGAQLSDIVAIAGDGEYSAALGADGTIWTWGRFDAPTPVRRPGISNIVAMAWGMMYMVVIKSDGTVWDCIIHTSWLGGETTNRLSPTQLRLPDGKLLTGSIAIASGFNHAMVLREDGTVWAWGRNESGELGDGTTVCKHTPVQVSGLSGIIAIAARNSTSVALKKDGTVWTWGARVLGNGKIERCLTPVQAPDLSDVVAITGNSRFAVRKDGTAWSLDAVDEPAAGTSAKRSSRAPLTRSDGTPLSAVVDIVSGQNHSVARVNEE